MPTNIKELDPVQGLVDYVLDIKPYHTKIVEVLIENVHDEGLDVTIQDGLHTNIHLHRGIDSVSFIPCEDGFGELLYGSPNAYPIYSPNSSIIFEDYPAINDIDNTFILQRNKVPEFQPGLSVRLSIFVEDYSNIHDIIASVAGPAGSGSFTVPGDQTATFVPAYLFYVTGSLGNDKVYTVSSSVFSAPNTIINVDQSVAFSSPTGYLGLRKLHPLTLVPGAFTDDFTISDAEFNPGFIDSWPDQDDPDSFIPGNDEHTIVTVVEPLPTLPPLAANRAYIATATLQGLLIESILYYSNFYRRYDSLVPEVLQTPDEGLIRLSILSVTSNTILVSGNLNESNIFSGDKITITQSTSNNGTYTISTITYNVGDDETTITITGVLPSLIVDGLLEIDIPSNTFIVIGDFTDRFVQGNQFNVVGGSVPGRYNTLYSDFSNGKTRIRVAENILRVDEGVVILDTTATDFIVVGNKTAFFTSGIEFNVIGNIGNDGFYSVDSSTYDSINDVTEVTVNENVLPNISGGEIQIFSPGLIKSVFLKFDEQNPLCSLIPDTMVRVYFDEYLRFDGLGFDFHDDVIAYNFENTDSWGYELPLRTLIESPAPVIPEQLTPPVSPDINDLWFDTGADLFKQWNGTLWKKITTAYWVDSATSLMYYRTRNASVDTGWVLYFAQSPGTNHVIPAVGSVELIGQEEFYASALGDVDYTLTSLSVPGTDPSLIVVTINQIPAGIDLTSDTEFTITSPIVEAGDKIVARVYDRTATETNAHVGVFGGSEEPHKFFHAQVSVDVVNNAYILPGGNFIYRFTPDNSFEGFDYTTLQGVVGEWNTTTFPIVNVDVGTFTLSIPGDYEWLFETGCVFRVKTFTNDHIEYVVASSNYDGTNTDIVTTSTDGFAGIDRYSGAIYSAVYNPIVDSGDPTDQVKTIVVVTNLVDNDVDSIQYIWTGPVRFYISQLSVDLINSTMVDGLGATNELLGVPDRFFIIDTDRTANTFRVHYDDPTTTDPVDLTDVFAPGTYFQVVGSYSNSNPSSSETNDALYIVDTSTFDSGTGDTIITIETNFDNVPPLTSFTVVSVTNDGGGVSGVNQIQLSGNHVNIFSGEINNIYQLSQPLVSATPLINVITILNVQFNAGNTILTVDEHFINTAFTGVIGIIDARYRVDVVYDDANTTLPWVDGMILREAFRIDNTPENVTSTTIAEQLMFGWGTTHQWPIIETDSANDTIFIEGDFTGVIDPSEAFSIIGSLGNDGQYEVVSVTYNIGNNETEIVVASLPTDPPNNLLGLLRLQDVDITSWFQYLINTLDSTSDTIIINGDATSDIQNGQQIRVLGTDDNNGLYTVTSPPTFNGITTSFTVNNVAVTENGGWVESHRYFGIRLVFEDTVGVTMLEEAAAEVLTDGPMIGSWEHNSWDIASFDEGLGTVIYLYSNSF